MRRRAQGLERRKGAGLVPLHEPAVADDIGREDGDEPVAGTFSAMCCPVALGRSAEKQDFSRRGSSSETAPARKVAQVAHEVGYEAEAPPIGSHPQFDPTSKTAPSRPPDTLKAGWNRCTASSSRRSSVGSSWAGS